jgi:hypothetical protein
MVCVGVLMNTRALMKLIVLNVGMDLGVIPPAVYCMLRGSSYEQRLADRGFLAVRRAH